MKIFKYVEYFEKTVILALLFIVGIITLITTYELVITVIHNAVPRVPSEKSLLILNSEELLSVFSFVLLIIIGLELFEAIKQYLNNHVLQAEIILIVALTAIARKVIVLDYSKYEPLTVIGIAALVLALSVSYFLIKKVTHWKS